MHLRCFLTLGALLALAAAHPARLRGDIARFKDGSSVEGKVETDREAGTVTVETPSGKVTRPLSELAEVVKKKLPAEEFDERFAKLGDAGLNDLAELASWAREKGLQAESKRVCRRILAIDPNHEVGRRGLGYVLFDNRWVLEKDLRAASRDKGLVRLDTGEWITAEEKERRAAEEGRKELEAHFRGLTSTNPFVRETAVRRLMAYRGPQARQILSSYLDDAREAARLVAVSALAAFPAKGEGPGDDPEATAIARRLFRLLPGETSDHVARAVGLSLRAFHPAEGFRLALAVLQGEAGEAQRRRAAEVLHHCLRKKWVPELCRALVTAGGDAGDGPGGAQSSEARREHAAVREALRRDLGQDFGYDVAAWLRWWDANAPKFQDHP